MQLKNLGYYRYFVKKNLQIFTALRHVKHITCIRYVTFCPSVCLSHCQQCQNRRKIILVFWRSSSHCPICTFPEKRNHCSVTLNELYSLCIPSISFSLFVTSRKNYEQIRPIVKWMTWIVNLFPHFRARLRDGVALRLVGEERARKGWEEGWTQWWIWRQPLGALI